MPESGKASAYAKALRLIEQAAKNRWASLSLSNLGLAALPPEIGKLTELAQLLLFDNQLTALPPETGNLASLTGLHLERNQLTTLPPEIGKLENLTELTLAGNPLGPELAAAYGEGLDAVKRYLRRQAEEQTELGMSSCVSECLQIGEEEEVAIEPCHG